MKQEKQATTNRPSPSVAADAIKMWLARENKILSTLAERSVNNEGMLRMCNIAAAFGVVTLSANYSIATTIVGLAWMLTAIVDIKRHFKRG